MSEKKSNITRRSFMTVGSAAIVSPLLLNAIVEPHNAFSAQYQEQEVAANEEGLDEFRKMMNYSDSQWKTWKSNPKNLLIFERGKIFENYKLIAEVTNSTGCAAGHKVGQRIVYAGTTLVSSESPEKICFGLLSAINPSIYMFMEKVLNGDDPTQIVFTKHHCPDVGVDNGGWGEVIVEVKVEKVQA
jgi:uncharacterized repeat protein (TIGR04076 family)